MCSMTHEMVHVSGQIIIEVVEDPIAIAETDAGPRFFRNVPGQFGLISLPGLVEGRLGQGGASSLARWRSVESAACTVHCTTTVDLVEIGILRNAVGPKIKFLDQAQMLGQVHCGLEIEYVGNSVRAGCPSAGEGAGDGTRDQTVERLVQWRARCRRNYRKKKRPGPTAGSNCCAN